jgi:flagellar biosynthesis chaperone FliJ
VAIVGRERTFIDGFGDERVSEAELRHPDGSKPLGLFHHTMAARSLETILLLRRRAEDSAARALGVASRARERAEGEQRRLEHLAEEAGLARGAAGGKLEARGGARSVDEEIAARGHVARLGDDMRLWSGKVRAHRQGPLARARKGEDKARASWLAARAAREAVERKVDEANALVRAQAARRAQDESDDRSTHLYVEGRAALRGRGRT